MYQSCFTWKNEMLCSKFHNFTKISSNLSSIFCVKIILHEVSPEITFNFTLKDLSFLIFAISILVCIEILISIVYLSKIN